MIAVADLATGKNLIGQGILEGVVENIAGAGMVPVVDQSSSGGGGDVQVFGPDGIEDGNAKPDTAIGSQAFELEGTPEDHSYTYLPSFAGLQFVAFAPPPPGKTAIPGEIPTKLPHWERAMGHHWLSQSIVLERWTRLSKEAREYALGCSTGWLKGGHNGGKVNGVVHHKYTAEVKKQFNAMLNSPDFTDKVLSEGEVKTFIENIRDGKSWEGELLDENHPIRRYNEGIKAKIPPNASAASDEAIRGRGKEYLKSKPNKFRAIAIIGALGSMLYGDVAGAAKAAEVMGGSGKFREAIAAANRGHLGSMLAALFGPGGSWEDGFAAPGGFVAEMREAGVPAAFIEAFCKMFGELYEKKLQLGR